MVGTNDALSTVYELIGYVYLQASFNSSPQDSTT